MEFKTGDTVEVSSDEEGFRGAWFKAMILRSMPKLGRYTVVYDSIVQESNASKHLQETVSADHVRPRPPPACEGAFALNQRVDAFYNDGWWSGVVSGASGCNKETTYSVIFPDTGDLIEFQPSELRAHLDWVNGEWMTNPTKMMFSKGTSVEVSSDDEGFSGAWFPATVFKSVDDKFLVEYRDLTTDDGAEHLKEIVDSLHLRPAAPDTTTPVEFKHLEEVDAYYKDGWWVGVISKVLNDSRYIVYFKSWKEEMQFGHKDLRPHFDWINGRWVQASQVKRLHIVDYCLASTHPTNELPWLLLFWLGRR